MKRKIITIDSVLCNGCGECLPNCPEGALRIIDGKARLISDLFCDGLGACIGHCPVGAILIEEREAEAYSEKKVMSNIIPQGTPVIKAHLEHLKDHNEMDYLKEALDLLAEKGISVPITIDSLVNLMTSEPETKSVQNNTAKAQLFWPIQLQLINPDARYFDNAEIIIAADCVPFTYGDFHNKLLQGKVPVIFCPKLDQGLDEYIEKLALIFRNHPIKSITIVHMEVPCCFGLNNVVLKALEKSKQKTPVDEIIISINGTVKQ